MGFVIAAAVAFVALGVAITLELRLNRRNRPIWDKEEAEPIRFSTAVLLKREPALRWALGARGSTLIVRSKAFSVAGAGESVSWHFNAPDSTIEWVQSRIGFRAKQEWIAIAIQTVREARRSVHPSGRVTSRPPTAGMP